MLEKKENRARHMTLLGGRISAPYRSSLFARSFVVEGNMVARTSRVFGWGWSRNLSEEAAVSVASVERLRALCVAA